MSRVIALALVVFALAGWVGHGISHSAKFSDIGAQSTVTLTAPEHASPLAKLPDAGRSLGTQTQGWASADTFGDDAAPLIERSASATNLAFGAAVFTIAAAAAPLAGRRAGAQPRAPPQTPVL